MAGATLFLEPGIQPGHLSQVALPTVLVLGKLGLAVLLVGFFAATFGAALETGLSCGYAIAQYFGFQWGKFVRPADTPRFHLITWSRSRELTAVAGRVLEAGLHLLDRQLVDRDGRLAGKVDDLELEFPEGGGPPRVTAILAGPGALGRRIGGRLGAAVEAVADRLRDGDGRRPARVPFSAVKRIGSTVELSVPRAELETNRLEAWTRDHLIGHLPGAGDAPE